MSTSPSSSGGGSRQSRSGGESPFSVSWVLAAGLIGLVVIAFVVLLLTREGTPRSGATSVPTSAQPTTPVSNAPLPTTSETAVDGACTQAATATGEPITSAPKTSWKVTRGLAVPTTEAGPASVKGLLAQCYKPDALGALTAAANIMLRSQLPDSPVLDTQFLPPLTSAQKAEKARGQLKPPYPQIAGFRMSGPIVGNQVTVTIFMRGDYDGRTVTVGMPVRMVWTGADWKVVNEQFTPDTSEDFVEWQGV